MNVSLYQAAAAMNANERWQEVVSENLATSSIPGARKQEISFSSVEAGVAAGAAGQNGGKFCIPSTSISYSMLPGTLRPTSLPTDLAMEGPGFIEVQLPNGNSAYTRDGELHFNGQGQLVTKRGYSVLGDAGPIQCDASNSTPVTIGPGGEITQGGELKGKMKLAEFKEPKQLQGIGDGYFINNDPKVQALPATNSQVRQGFLEAANTSPTTEMASLITSMRMFEANQKVMQMQDDRLGRIITDLGTPA